MYEIKAYQYLRKFCPLVKELETKRYLTKPGNANNSDYSRICRYLEIQSLSYTWVLFC